MKKSRLLGAVCVFFLASFSANTIANLLDRGGGMIYDTDLNITWLANANYVQASGYDSDGLLNWIDAVAWAENLNYGGFNDWRLPTTLQPDPSCDFHGGIGDYGLNCTGSEMGHLFYTELGGTAQIKITNSTDTDLMLFDSIRVDFGTYWSGTELASNTTRAWEFSFINGDQRANNPKGIHSAFSWAVRDGDVAAIPLPAAAWLFASGLLGLIGMARKKRHE